MFGKKLLSVVGLLFLGSQIISVKGEGCAKTLSGDTCDADICTEGDVGLHMIGDKIVEVKEDTANVGEFVCKLLKGAAGNYCTTASGSVVSTIDGYCSSDEKSCDTNGKTYHCDANGVCTEDGNPIDCQRAQCQFDSETKKFVGCVAGDYLVVNVVNEVVEIGSDPVPVVKGLIETAGNNDGKLYGCDGSKCELVSGEIKTGYYKNAGSIILPYINCIDGVCSPVGPVEVTGLSTFVENKGCDGSNNGGLVRINGKVNICLDTNVPFSLEGVTTPEKYFMNINSAVPFNENQSYYAVVEVSEDEIYLHKENDLINGKPDMYQYTNNGLKIFAKSDKSQICGNKNQILEFKLKTCSASPKDVAYYEKVSAGL